MSNSADVGKLRLVMEADTGEIEKSVDDVQSRLDKFATRIGITAAVVEKAMDIVTDAVVSAVGAVIDGFRNAVSAAAELDDLSQRVGIAAGRLSELKYAADVTGLPITTLTTGLQKLAKVMQEVAGGDVKTPAARALDALGISATDSSGRLRDMESVLLDAADRFSSYRDSAQKSALAVALFGEQGTKLLPFLNEGREGIARLSAESQKFGVAISTGAAKAAAELEDNLEKLAQTGETFYRQVAQRVTPALIVLTQELLGSREGYNQVSTGAKLTGDALVFLASTALQVKNIFAQLAIALTSIGETMSKFAVLDFTGAEEAAKRGADAIEAQALRARQAMFALNQEAEKQPAFGAGGASGLQGFTGGGQADDGKQDAPRAQGASELAAAQKAANEALAEGNRLWREGTALINSLQTPMEAYHASLEKIGKLQAANAISADTAARAQAKAALVLSNAYANAAGSIVSDMGKVFEGNKAVAIASALINTYQGVTNALATAPWPLNIAAAAAALAAGMAQVANIRSTNKNGGGGGGSVGGSSLETGGGSGQAPQMISLSLAPGRYSRDDVRQIIEEINKAVDDGAVIKVR